MPGRRSRNSRPSNYPNQHGATSSAFLRPIRSGCLSVLVHAQPPHRSREEINPPCGLDQTKPLRQESICRARTLAAAYAFYSHGEPGGLFQYGLMEELPRIDNNPKYRKLASASGRRLWRITCFVVHQRYRRRGVARTALRQHWPPYKNREAAWSKPIQSDAGELTRSTEERYRCSKGRDLRSSPRSGKAMC